MPSRHRHSGEKVDGLLLFDKPKGISSNRALQICKKLFNAKKAGHTGSLDPLATGLLPLCFGHATKISGMLLDSKKSYRVTIKLGISTDSGDSEGSVVSESPVKVTKKELEACLDCFRGEIEQIPPMFSAIKLNGQPLYKLARKGKEVDRKPRSVIVYSLMLKNYSDDIVELDIECSKGFYVRSLAMDLGDKLGCGAHVADLRRIGVGQFSIEHSVTLEQLEALDNSRDRQKLLVPLDSALEDLPKVAIPDNVAQNLCQGQSVRIVRVPITGLARLYTDSSQFLGLGEVSPEGKVAPKRIFV